MLTAGLGGAVRHGCAAIADGTRLTGVCGQERVTRLRDAGFNASGLPDEALDVLLSRMGRSRRDVARYTAAEPISARDGHVAIDRIDHHLAHACTAYLTSPFSSAVIVVCDEDAPKVSVWEARNGSVSPVPWEWTGDGFMDVYARCGIAFGGRPGSPDHRLEALARLHPASRDHRVNGVISGTESSVAVRDGFERVVGDRLAGLRDTASQASVAATLQAELGDAFLTFLAAVRRLTSLEHLCLGGSLFFYSWINTLAKGSGLFADVFVPIDPGNGGLSVGTALQAVGAGPGLASPFLGPVFADHEIKEVLDNCKLHYGWESEEGVIATAVRALQQGTLVGWFDGPMEWGPRALGARCILANPFAPYVLENLNVFLKRREPWRGYALSAPEAAVLEHFEGPARAPFMESDYRPRDPDRFANVLPSKDAIIRVQTVGLGAMPRFRRLLDAFGAATGLPFLVNTSFNGFHEPIVCSPRDAVRVFYGSGLDLLILDRFILRK